MPHRLSIAPLAQRAPERPPVTSHLSRVQTATGKTSLAGARAYQAQFGKCVASIRGERKDLNAANEFYY